MKKLLVCAAAAVCMAAACGGVRWQADAEEMPCKAAFLMEEQSGEQLFAKNETARLPIASMCKIMTLLLAFEAADAGELRYDEEIVVSERAAGMGGSQVFLGAGLSYRADELLKSIAVCSANDSCVAIAERLAGSEGAFCTEMNARAAELGAENTLFANCTGLPKEPQYSCAKDVALMLRALHAHEKYREYCKIRVEDFAHPDGRTTQMTNTNKLVRAYRGCDSGKTGFTNEAGFCLAAAAERGGMRVISVVIGADSSERRFQAASSLFDHAFDNFESVSYLTAGEHAKTLPVRGSRVRTVGAAGKETLAAVRRRGTDETCELRIETGEVCAPVKAGDNVGTAVLFREGVEIGRTDLVALEDAPRYSWWDALREEARLWNAS